MTKAEGVEKLINDGWLQIGDIFYKDDVQTMTPKQMMRHECCGSNEEHYTSCPAIEIEENCVENNHAIRFSLIEDRAYPIICTECIMKIEKLEEK